MTTGAMLKTLHLDDAAFAAVKEAVQKAEAKTNGEIALAVTAESAPYAFWELFAAVLVSAAAFAFMLPFAGALQKLSMHLFWETPVWYLPFLYGMAVFCIIIAVFYLLNIPVLDRFVIPRPVRSVSVTQRALRYFTESGVYNTKEHSGILIFASCLEQQVRIVADAGIAEKIPQDLWNIIADAMAADLAKGSGQAAFTEAVQKCSELLAEHFPAKEENPDELPDGLVVV